MITAEQSDLMPPTTPPGFHEEQVAPGKWEVRPNNPIPQRPDVHTKLDGVWGVLKPDGTFLPDKSNQ